MRQKEVKMRELSYQYKNLPIPGGGYVTGFIFHKKKKGILYLRNRYRRHISF